MITFWADSPPLWDASSKKLGEKRDDMSELEKPSKQSSSLSPQATAGVQIKLLKEGIWNVADESTCVCIVGLWYWSCMVPS